MVHPKMFDDADPVLARVREICLAFAGAAERVSHGRPNFYTRKTFASYGGSVKGSGHSYECSVLVLPDPDERAALVARKNFFVPAYVGPAGWVGVDLSADPDFDELAELVDASYRNTAPARLIAQHDQSLAESENP